VRTDSPQAVAGQSRLSRRGFESLKPTAEQSTGWLLLVPAGDVVVRTYSSGEIDLEVELRASWPAWDDSYKGLITAGIGFPGKHGPTYRRATVDAADKAPDMFQEILAAARTLRPGA
jgi:hypothetical protein